MIRMRVHVAAIHPFSIHPSSTSTFHHLPPPSPPPPSPPPPLGYCLSRANQIIPGVPFRPCVKSFVQWEFFSFFFCDATREMREKKGGSGENCCYYSYCWWFDEIWINFYSKNDGKRYIILSIFTSLYIISIIFYLNFLEIFYLFRCWD